MLFLSGGPPQHETFDPKPMAPSEIRGPFRPIDTKVPGIHVGTTSRENAVSMTTKRRLVMRMPLFLGPLQNAIFESYPQGGFSNIRLQTEFIHYF